MDQMCFNRYNFNKHLITSICRDDADYELLLIWRRYIFELF